MSLPEENDGGDYTLRPDFPAWGARPRPVALFFTTVFFAGPVFMGVFLAVVDFFRVAPAWLVFTATFLASLPFSVCSTSSSACAARSTTPGTGGPSASVPT